MGLQLRKMLSSHVVVVFGATSRIGRATIEELTSAHQQERAPVAVVAAVEDVKDARARRLRHATNCYLVKCKFGDLASVRRVVRNADSVLLVPALSESGTRFSKRVIDAVQAEAVPRLVIISSILATNDFWQRTGSGGVARVGAGGGDRRTDGEDERAGPAPSAAADFGYEAVEAHARTVLTNCVSLRIPLLMETIMYCREEILFAHRFYGCFDPDTPVPCIAVADVAAAAAGVLAQPSRKFNATYCLAHADVTVSPREVEARLSRMLAKHVKYRRVSDEKLVTQLRDSGATQYVAESIVRMKDRLECRGADAAAGAARVHARTAEEAAEAESKEGEAGEPSGAARHVSAAQQARASGDSKPTAAGAPAQSATAAAAAAAPHGSSAAEPSPRAVTAERRRLQAARLAFTSDFELLAGRALTSPSAWLERNIKHFERSAQSQMQLFVVGSAEGFFAEFERFLAAQVTSATPMAASDVGEAALPTSTTGVVQGKVTFCAIKSAPAPEYPGRASASRRGSRSAGAGAGGSGGGSRSESHFYQLPGGELSPLNQMLQQLTELDVMVYIPPLHLGAAERVEVTKVVAAAAAQANVWGLVLVSSLFAGLGSSPGLSHLTELERIVERSGVPFTIVRLPLFMEYFLALSSADHVHARDVAAGAPAPSSSTVGPPATFAGSAGDDLALPPASAAAAPGGGAPPAAAAATSSAAPATAGPATSTVHLGEEKEEKRASAPPPPQQQKQPNHSKKQSAHEPEAHTTREAQQPATTAATTTTSSRAVSWHLLDRSLSTSPQYLIAMVDAAKALAAIVFTFPLHRGRTRALYTERLTMREVEAVLQRYAYKGRAIDFAQTSALLEEPGREFWKVAYWPAALTKELLECSVTLSARATPLEMSMPFEEVTDCEPISLAHWARANAKAYTFALEVSSDSEGPTS